MNIEANDLRLHKAARMSGWFFLSGAAACAVGMWLVVWAYLALRHFVIGEPPSWRANWLFPSFYSMAMLALLALVGGTVAFVAVAWPMGRIVGGVIALRQRHFAWVGPLAMTLPTIIAAIVATLCAQVLSDGRYLGHGKQFWPSFFLSTLLCVGWFLIPAIVTGLLSGLSMRQWGRKMQELTPQTVLQ